MFITSLGSSATAQAQAPVILVLGDSLSAAYGIERHSGWVQLLQNRLRETGYPHRVVNASVSGDTTRNGVTRLPQALKQHRPDILIIELGGNDGLRGLSLEELGQNLEQMIQLAKKNNVRVLLCSLRIPPNLGPVYGSKFLETFHEAARRHKVNHLKYLLQGVSDNPDYMQEDGIHPNTQGQPLIMENVWGELASMLGTSTAIAR